jgi:hypothetical protein
MGLPHIHGSAVAPVSDAGGAYGPVPSEIPHRRRDAGAGGPAYRRVHGHHVARHALPQTPPHHQRRPDKTYAAVNVHR